MVAVALGFCALGVMIAGWIVGGALGVAGSVITIVMLTALALFFFQLLRTPGAWEANTARSRQMYGRYDWMYPKFLQSRVIGWFMIALLGINVISQIRALVT